MSSSNSKESSFVDPNPEKSATTPVNANNMTLKRQYSD